MTAISIQELTKVYSNGVQALKGVNLEVKSGDFFALLGANGAGKTTIIGILTGLVNKTSGQVKVFDFDIDTQVDQAKQTIGVVPQEFNFNMFEKVLDIVVNQAGYYGIPRDEALPRAKEVLAQLGLSDKLDVQSRTLSGGMKRRLMIARALIHKPKLLILDEPTAGVDVELRFGMWEYLTKLNKEGVTILLTTHYLEEVEQLCQNAAIIKQGEIITNDSVRNLLRSLEKETYVVDVKKVTSLDSLDSAYQVKTIDDSTIEVTIQKNSPINLLLEQLTKVGIEVMGIRPKGNRLEELFLGILKS